MPDIDPRGADTKASSPVNFPQRPRLTRIAGAVLAAAALTASTSSFGLPAAASTASPSTSQATVAASDDVLRVATSGYVDSFNPFTSYYSLPTGLFRYMYENLVQYDQAKGEPTEGLAEKWETSEDGKTWTFHLHKDLKWSDNEPLTSKDPAWTYTQMMKSSEMGAANGNLVENFDKVETPDDQTLVIKLKTPQAANPGIEIPVVPEHIWSKQKDPSKWANDKATVGSGPYQIESYQANQHITLKANPNFWRGAPKINGIEYVYYTNPDASVQALRASEVDLVSGLTPNQFKSLNGVEGVATNPGKGKRFTSLALNPGYANAKNEPFGTGNAALKDVKVRQAIRLGIDIDSLRKQVLQDQASKATAFIPDAWSDWHVPDDQPGLVSFNPDEAKKKLDEAGWKAGKDGIREKDGKKLELRFDIDSTDPDQQTMSDYLGPWMKDIGIKLNVKSSDSDTLSTRTAKGDYDVVVSGWGTSPDPDYQLSINTCASRPNADGTGPTTQDGWCNPEFDKLYKQQHAELDKGKRQELVRKAQMIHYNDAPSITLWYAKNLEGYRSDRFEDFGLQPSDGGSITNQSGYWGFFEAKPVSGAKSGGGVPTGVWVGGGIVVLLIIGGVVFAVLRRKSADDRA